MIIEGAISVKAAILNGNREVHRVYLRNDKKTKDLGFIEKICLNKNIEVIKTDRPSLDEFASGKTHGGVLALVDERKENEFTDGDIFYLDGIEDPFNLGYALRTLYAFGFKNVLLSDRDYSFMEAQLLKSSAGAYDMINIQKVAEPQNKLKELKEKGYHLYGLYRGEGSKDVFDVSYDSKSIFILGGEKRGINSAVLDLCDDYLFISYGSDFRNALNACAALDVLATLVYRQRRND